MSRQNHGHENSGDSKTEIKGTPGNPSVESTEKIEGETLTGGAEQKGAVSGAPEAEAPGAGPEAAPHDWEQKAAELEAKLADLNDQYLRKAADFENFRKRVNREKQELTDFANQNLILALLPVIDDFERAIKSAETCAAFLNAPAFQSGPAMQCLQDFKSFYEGIVMIEKRLYADLESRWGLKRFDSEGQPFDPNRHEALQVEKAADVQEPVVKEDYVKGYLLKDRVIRFAKVKVLMPDGAEPPAAEPSG
jgi:molecular chaperone GrpE